MFTLFAGVPKFGKRIMHLIKLSHAERIARRFFVMNAFDGALTMSGVVLGSFVAGISSPEIILALGTTTTTAMFSSGVWGAYLTEGAERKRELKDLERQMLVKLDKTEIGAASRAATLVTALVDGVSPVLSAFVISIPFVFVLFDSLSMESAYYVSFVASFSTFFALGLFLARVSGEKWWVLGLKMLLAGIVSALLGFGLTHLEETVFLSAPKVQV